MTKKVEVELDTKEAMEVLQDVQKEIPNTPVAPAHGIAAIALGYAMKYHDISTVQDGELYQQYKLEGRNMVPLHLDMVFHTAAQMEAWLLGASERISKLVMDAVVEAVDEAERNAPGTTVG